jgi:acetyl esterase/lipase
MKFHRILLPIVLVANLALAENTNVVRDKAGRRTEFFRPTPDLTNYSYGPYERNVLDLWKAKSDKPTPLVVSIHGGGFCSGDKSGISVHLLRGLLSNGISMMAINYRLSPGVHFPTHYMDCARAIQFARLHAKEWNIDPKRIGATGGSAGAGTSLWIGFHDDMADPKNADPVLRQSTRLSCMAVLGAQSTYDLRLIKEWVGEAAARHPAFEGFYGITTNEWDTPKAHKLYEEASAINYLTADDPPVFLFYNEPYGPLKPNAKPGTGIHHPYFGAKLKDKMDPLKIECIMKHKDDYERDGDGGKVNEQMNADMVRFFVKHLKERRRP